MNQTYLVTGCAGFIGSVVTRQLLDAGHQVFGVDSLDDAYPPRLKEWRLAQLINRPTFHFYAHDITNALAIRQLFEHVARQTPHQPPFAAVINLAARAGVRYSVQNPWIYLEVNANGALHLLEGCKDFGVPKFVQASTSSVYGETAPRPFVETALTNRPCSPYAASKKFAEVMAYTYHLLHGLDISVLRYFTVYGPAGRPDMAIFRFISWIANRHPLKLFGDGTAQRDFTFVEDIARGTIAALKPVGYEIINLGGDQPVEIKQVIHELEQLLGQPAVIHSLPPHRADVPVTWANISKARTLLGWEPHVSLSTGLQQCVAWYEKNRLLADSLLDITSSTTTQQHKQAA